MYNSSIIIATHMSYNYFPCVKGRSINNTRKYLPIFRATLITVCCLCSYICTVVLEAGYRVCRMSFNICERETSYCLIRSLSTIKLPQWRFQALLDVSLVEKLIWKSRRPQNKASIRGASPGISYKLRNKDAIGGRGWNIATQGRKICDVEIEIVTFVINRSVKLTVPPDRQK